jgi:hypothetical protein
MLNPPRHRRRRCPPESSGGTGMQAGPLRVACIPVAPVLGFLGTTAGDEGVSSPPLIPSPSSRQTTPAATARLADIAERLDGLTRTALDQESTAVLAALERACYRIAIIADTLLTERNHHATNT